MRVSRCLPRRVSVKAPKESNDFLELNNCHAVWKSGAKVDFNMSVPLSVFNDRVVITKVLPLDSPAYLKDLEVGKVRDRQLAGMGDDLINGFNGLVSAYNSYKGLEHSFDELERAQEAYAQDRMRWAGESATRSLERNQIPATTWVNVPVPQDSFVSKPFKPLDVNLSSVSTTLRDYSDISNGYLHPIAADKNSTELSIEATTWTPVRSLSGCYGSVLFDMCWGVMQSRNEPAYCTGQLVQGVCSGFLLSVDTAYVFKEDQ